MQKSLAARIPIIAAVGAPSSLAIAFAEKSGQALLGFIRDGRCNLYTPR
jgi:FdhD protein